MSIIRDSKEWSSIKLPETNKLLSLAIDNMAINPNNDNRYLIFKLIKDSQFIVGVDEIPKKEATVHVNMLALSSPENGLALLAFTSEKSLIDYSLESKILCVDPYHIFKRCIELYDGGLILCSSSNSVRFSPNQINELLNNWKKI